MRGYDNTSKDDVFSVFVMRATVMMKLTLLLVKLLICVFRRGVRRLTTMPLDTLFS